MAILPFVVAFISVLLEVGGIAVQSLESGAQQMLRLNQGGHDAPMPVAVKQELPSYSAEAAAAGIRGAVEVETVVSVDGRVIDARLVRSLGDSFGLDRASTDAIKKWRFRPVQVQGRRVPVLFIVRMDFTPPEQPGQAAVTASLVALQSGRSAGSRPMPSDVVDIRDKGGKAAPGVRHPKLLRRVQPSYTTEAMRAKVVGNVEVTAVILADGTVGEVQLTKSLHADLDREAIGAVRYWLFEPGTVDGRPAAMRVTCVLLFRLI